MDQTATATGLSRPNLLYHFRTKGALYAAVRRRTLDMWLQPLQEFESLTDSRVALSAYITRKLDYSRSHPTASRLFAMETLQGALHLGSALVGNLSDLVEVKSRVIASWIPEGRLRPVDPKPFIFAVWATTQHDAEFSTQIRAHTGKGLEENDFYESTRAMLSSILLNGVLPREGEVQDV